METLYFYDYGVKKEVGKILEDDFLKRTGYIVRECKVLDSARKGYFLYLCGTPESIKKIDELFADMPVEKLSGKEAKEIIEKIESEGESAATGMGMIFG